MHTKHSQSFGKSLFYGDIREELIFPFPQLLPSEQQQTKTLLAALSEFARSVDSRRIDREAGLPAEVLDGMRRLGLFGLNIPSGHGGLGLSTTACARVFDALGAVDSSIALTLGSHAALAAGALVHFGTDEQHRRYLPRLASGELLASFAIAEPLAGSDAGSIRTRAEPNDTGYLLNGTKLWVLNGGLADLSVLFAQTQLIRDGARVDRITGFLAERGSGLRAGAEEAKLGARGSSTTALYLEDLQLGPQQVLGSVGGGFKVAMDTLNRGRLCFAASSLGMARELLRLSVQHATSRRQYGRLISSFGMIKDKVARMTIDLYAAEAMLYLTSGLVDRSVRQGETVDFSVESACCKVFASEMLWRIANETLQIAAGSGYMADYPYERLLRDSRLMLIFPGTNEVLRCYIALTGLQGPGEELDKLADAIKFPLRGYGLVVDTLIEKVRVAAYGRALVLRHHSRLKKEAVFIEDAAESLAREVERVLRRHGRQISEMQYVQRRVADMMIDLYAMCAAVSRCSASLAARDARHARGGSLSEASGEMDDAERELRLCTAFCNRANARIREALARSHQNDDELMKTIADDSYHGRPYPFDAVL